MSGKLYVVGIGPGGMDHLTPAAKAAIECARTIVGYSTYIELVRPLLAGKEILSSGMRSEVERCRDALARAAAGETVALISSGDAGIYGMAGLVLELRDGETPEVEVVPGVSAVQMAAARLGAPLMHDFAVISLSDLLTPWGLIRQRLDAAGRADFVIALYNPKSRGRTTQIEQAREILLRHRDPQTPVGIVRHAGRTGEEVQISTLEKFTSLRIDMFCVVLIGNRSSRLHNGQMVTPRGYAGKYFAPGEETQEKPRALFIGGTGSDVGKSLVTSGLCRLFARRGYRVAPFKAQNMALNSAVTPQGGEIGRAQALQAAACGLAPHVDMNPVLLKPNSETGSQVIVQGKAVGNMTVQEYHRFKPEAFAAVKTSFTRLRAVHDLVILEGAGSIAEINLRAHDITNLKAAQMAQAPVLLVADIDRGGVFAAIVGTLDLLTPEERAMVAGVVINKFRGDPSLLAPGIAEIEARCGVPVLGVIPHISLQLPEEDSVALVRHGRGRSDAVLQIGVIRLPRLSNYTDFDPLEAEPQISLRYIDHPEELEGLDLVILPGSKSTLADLAFLHQQGLTAALLAYHHAGGRIAGVCGGYQMLGKAVHDPDGVEGEAASAEGLGLLDVETVMAREKQTCLTSGVALSGAESLGLISGMPVTGYEIHMGRTTLGPGASPLWSLDDGALEGAMSHDGRVWGSYLHGLFDDAPLRRALLTALLPLGKKFTSAQHSIEAELDRLADHLAAHLNLEQLQKLLAPPQEKP